MEYSHRVENGICILSFSGKIVENEIDGIRDSILAAVNPDANKGLVIDLEEVPYLDSSGIGFFVWIFKKFKKTDAFEAPLTICHLSSQNQKLFSLTQLDKLIRIYPTFDEAYNVLVN